LAALLAHQRNLLRLEATNYAKTGHRPRSRRNNDDDFFDAADHRAVIAE
jgi:hypothetical protein